MALKRSLVQRLFGIYKITDPALTHCRITSAAKALAPPNPDKIAPDPGDDGIFRRFLHRLPSYALSLELRSPPMGEGLIEKLRSMDIARDRIRLDGLILPAAAKVTSEAEVETLTVEDAKKLLRLSQLEMVKARLRQIERTCVSYAEFVEICAEGCWNREQGKEFAKMLDQSGNVIVLGNVVYLSPEQETE